LVCVLLAFSTTGDHRGTHLDLFYTRESATQEILLEGNADE